MEKSRPFCVPESHRGCWLPRVSRSLFATATRHRVDSLIVPRRHVRSFGESSPDEQSAMLAMLQRVRAMLDAELRIGA